MKKQFLNFLVCGLVLLAGCAKELSFETGGIPSKGSLQSDLAGDCLPKTVNGVYEATKPLVAGTNTVVVQVDVTSAGSYDIRSDTVNGYHFRGTGTFTTTGINNVILNGIGTPFAAGINNFVVSYDSTFCDFQVTVLPSGAGGPAVFTLTGTPNCTGATPNGSYGVGIPLNTANTVPIQVNVTTIGTYNITTTFQGMTFQKQGVFSTTGTNTVLLVGSGTPTTAGVNTVPLTAGSSTCSFVVNVGAAAQFTIDCPSVSVNGTYDQGVALGGAHTVDLNVNVTTAGVYAISVGPINGMTFTSNGTFPSTGTQSIVLQGSGTPINAGTSTFTLPGPTCTFDVVVNAGASIDWKFNDGTTLIQGGFDDGLLQTVPVPPFLFTNYAYSGSNVSGVSFTLILTDIGGGITNGEQYTTTSSTTNNVLFDVTDGGGSTLYEANATITGLTFKATVTTHNTATKTITGTFSGTVKDGAGNTKTITNGTFTGSYP
jgi:hypothetical protein